MAQRSQNLIEAMARLQEGQQKSLRRPRQLVEHESEPPKKRDKKSLGDIAQ